MSFCKRIGLTLIIFCATSYIMAQKNLCDNSFFSHLDISTSVGTTGIGLDLSTNLGSRVHMRAGFSYMPRFEVNSTFRVQVGDSLDKKWDKNGNRIETKFDKLSGYLKSFVGFEVDDEVKMTCVPTYYNFKLLFDVFPFSDKRWHFTAGFFAGPSEVARAYNTTEEMPSLLSVSMWNMFYDKAQNGEPFFGDAHFSEDFEKSLIEKFNQYGRMGFHAGDYTKDGPILLAKPGTEAFPIDFTDGGDPIYAFDEQNNPILVPVQVDSNGNPVRAYKKGDPYMMVPDEAAGMVKAYIKVNRFKPYLGFGYGGAISKDGLTQLSFDAGAMFWGGTPSMYTHDGTNLTKDVENVRGKLGNYVKAAKFFKVFPVIELRITRRIF